MRTTMMMMTMAMMMTIVMMVMVKMMEIKVRETSHRLQMGPQANLLSKEPIFKSNHYKKGVATGR